LQVKRKNVLIFVVSLVVSFGLALYLYLTSAPRPFTGEFGITIILGAVGSFIFSLKVKNSVIKGLLDISSSHFALAFLSIIFSYLLPYQHRWIAEYYAQSLVILGAMEFATALLVLPLIK
jgi:hypothetical protein